MRARRTDNNHSEIIARLRSLGACVYDCSRLGGGFPDLCVSISPKGPVALVEVKDGSRPPSRRRLTEDEQEFARDHKVYLVESEADCAILLKSLTQQTGEAYNASKS